MGKEYVNIPKEKVGAKVVVKATPECTWEAGVARLVQFGASLEEVPLESCRARLCFNSNLQGSVEYGCR